MTHFETLPVWAAIPVALLVLFGATLTLIGAIGLWRLPSFYDRLHAPTLGTSWGTAGIVLASILMFSVAGGRAVVHESVIAIFIMVTTPVTLMLLGRAALHRDRVEGNVPFQFTREDEIEAKAQQQLAQAEARANIIRAQEASLAAEEARVSADRPEEASEEAAVTAPPPDTAETVEVAPEAQAPLTLPETISPETVALDTAPASGPVPKDLFPKPPNPPEALGPHRTDAAQLQIAPKDDDDAALTQKKPDEDLPEY